jgi:regulator of sigma E protease
LFKKNGTLYSLNWIPLGGFVRPAGEDDPTIKDGLAAASIRARLFTLSAGAGANFLLALVIFWVAFMIGPPVRQVTIPAVMAGSPAEAAGIQSGDVIVQVNGRVVDDNSTIVVEEVSGSAGVPVEFLLLRNGEQISLSVTPRSPGEYDAEEDGPTGIQLALESTGENISVGPVRSLVRSVETIYDIIARTLQAPVMLIRGEISGDEARPSVTPTSRSQAKPSR